MNALLYGLSWSLPYATPELPQTSKTAEVSVNFGQFDESLIVWKLTGVCYKAAPGAYLLAVPGVARYLVTDGNQIIIDAETNVATDDIRHFLYHPVAGALLMQRGILPLQASAVEKDGSSALLLGGSAAGKSLLAAGMMQRGFKVIADGICAVHPGPSPTVTAGYPGLQLWKKTLQELGYDSAGLSRIRSGIEKFLLPVQPESYTLEATAGRIYRLIDGHTSPYLATPVTGQNKFSSLQGYTYHNPLIEAFGMQKEMFRILVSLAQAHPLTIISAPHDLAHAREFIDAFADNY